jgi:hypothetical protein
MSKNNPRVSRTGVTSGGRFALYSNSPEVNDFDPALVRIIRGNSLSSLYLSSGEVQSDDISDGDAFLVEGSESSEASTKAGESSGTNLRVGVPSLSDISIVSNTVVYDAAGQPSVTLVFKVKNSSGETLKGMNAKVELI